MVRPTLYWIAVVAVLGPNIACDDSSGGDATADSDDGAGVDDATGEATGDSCDDQPTITYNTFGAGFLANYCDSCHGANAVDRRGAPEDISFDDAAAARKLADRILLRSFDSENPMPPAGGITLADQERLKIWLECFQ